MPRPDRRQFLAAGAALGAPALGFASRLTDSIAVPIDDKPAPLPPRAVARLGSPRMRVGGYAHGTQFSADGRLLVAADRDAVWGWEAATGKTAFKFKYPAGNVSDGTVTADALVLVVSDGSAHDLRHYAMPSGELKSRVPLALTNTSNLHVGPGAAFLAQAVGETLRVLDGSTGKERHALSVANHTVGFVADGRLAVCSGDELRLYDPRTGKAEATLAGQGAKPNGGAVGTADGKWVAAHAGRNEDTVLVWDVTAGKLAHTIVTKGKALLFGPDHRSLFAATPDGVGVWDVTTGKKVRDLDLGSPSEVQVSPDGRVIASRSGEAVWLYDAATGKLLPHSADPPGTPNPLWFVGDGVLVGQLSTWGGWARWTVSREPSAVSREPKASASSATALVRMPRTGLLQPVGLSASGSVGVYRDEKSGEYTVREVATGKPVREWNPRNALVTARGATPDGRTVVAVTDEDVFTHDTTTGRTRAIRAGLKPADVLGPDGVAVSPDGRGAAVVVVAGGGGGPDGEPTNQVVLLDLAAGAEAGRFVAGPRNPFQFALDGRVERLAVAPGGRRVAVLGRLRGGQEGDFKSLTVFEAGRPTPLLALPRPDGDADSVVLAVSPDGRTIARPLADDKGVALREVAGGKVRETFAHAGDVSALAFSPDGRTLAVSCTNGPVLVWDVRGDRTVPLDPPDRTALDRAWAALADADAKAAFRAVQLLARFPDRAAPFLAGKFPQPAAADLDRVRALVAKLADDSFRAREAAQKELAGLLDVASGEMQRLLDAGVPPEAEQRLERLLKRADQMTPDRMRAVRAVEALEWSGSPAAAAAVLATWAAGNYPHRLSEEAARRR